MIALIFIMTQMLVIAGITYSERLRNSGPSDWLRNLQSWVIDLGASFLILPFFSNWKGAALIDGKALPFYIAFPIFILVRDFLEFAFHQAQHRVPLLWRMHSLHHSDPEMSALTTNRHFWGDQVIKAATIWPLTSVLISQTKGMLAIYAVVTLYNYFIHANIKVNFGRLSWLLNCPAYHRRHHSKLPQDYDSNFAALFPIWDVIFGSYRRPDGWPPTGLAKMPARVTDLVIWPFLNHEPVPAKAQAAENPVTAR